MSTPAPESRARPSIISPAIDLLCVGGLSILLLVPLLLSGRKDLALVGIGAQAWIATLINMPHFMASYRMVYRSPEMILRHKWASLYVPALLFLYALVALWQAQYSPMLVTLMVAVSSAYLAWHYTGQVWGMMASYAHMEGVRFDATERLLVRGSLRILLAWHVTWFIHSANFPWDVSWLYRILSAATIVALVMGAIGLQRMRRRIGRFPPLRTLVPWFAIFVWYAAMARDPRAIFWVQIFHAIQYLEFPVRVEINRTVAAAGAGGRAARLGLHMLGYAVILLLVSWLMGLVVPGKAMDVIAVSLGEAPGRVAPVLILTFINIHHYFTDGVIWKISNPEVRKDLFSHLPAPAKAPAAAPATAPGQAPAAVPARRKRRRR